MPKRRYTHIKEKEKEILAMKEAGYTKREIAEKYGYATEQIKGFLQQHRRRERKKELGILPKAKGRPKKETPETELERLRMENQLLRDFLRLTGRM